MTIKEFATNYQISTQAVYKKLKAENIPLSLIKQGNSQELTPEGINQLESIFFKKGKEEVETVERLKVENQLLNSQLEAIRADRDREKETEERLKAENQLLKAQIEEIKADRDRWAETAKTAQESLQREQQATHQAQAIQMATIQAIGKRPSLWARLTGKTKDEKQ